MTALFLFVCGLVCFLCSGFDFDLEYVVVFNMSSIWCIET